MYTMLQIAPFPGSPTPDFASKDSFVEEKVTRRGVGGGEEKRVGEKTEYDVGTEESSYTQAERRWKRIPPCIWWSVWRERNQRVFESNGSPIQKIKINPLLLFHCFV